MRKRTLSFVTAAGFLIVSTSTLNAQMGSSSSGARWMGGPFVGMNYTTVSGSDVSNAGYRAGIAAGGQLQVDFDGGLFFRTAALYSMRGATATESGTDITLKENFIDVPVVLGYSFASAGSTMKPFVMAGGLVGFKLSCNLEGKQSGTKVSVKCEDTIKDLSSVDYAAVGGGGVMFPVASGTVSIDGRYSYGLQKLNKSGDSKYRGFTVGLAYMIPFGH